MRLNRRDLLSSAAALGALGWTAPAALAQAPSYNQLMGGNGGRILRVTTLKPDGPGSITEAIKAKGKRVIVFEVGGVIDLDRKSLKISNGELTIAGQTAPAPGITFIKGGIEIGQGSRDVLIQHIAVRPGESGQAKKSGWECDGIYAYGASNVQVDHCSITWATDEGLSASGKRFGIDNKGATPADWRVATSHDIFFSNNLVAEGLSNSTHSKGEHSKGSLIHDNVRNANIGGSLYAHNMERNVLFKGGAQGVMRRCVVYNPGKRFVHYNLHANEWEGHPFETGDVLVADNVFIAGPSTDKKAAAFMLGGDADVVLEMHSNVMRGYQGALLAERGVFGSGAAKAIERPALAPTTHSDKSAQDLVDLVLASCGARPWDRDPIDARIIADVKNGTGKIINSEQDVGGYPVRPERRVAFVEGEWNLDTMVRR